VISGKRFKFDDSQMNTPLFWLAHHSLRKYGWISCDSTTAHNSLLQSYSRIETHSTDGQ